MNRDEEFRRLVAERFENVERTMKAELAKHLFQDMPSDYVYVPPTRWQKIERSLRNFKYALKARICGTWSLWIHGQCDYCEHESDW